MLCRASGGGRKAELLQCTRRATQEPVVELLACTPQAAVVCKPAGVPFHRDPETGTDGVMQLVRRQHAGLGLLYPVHRLDAVTSGALILARTPAAAARIVTEFRARRVAKYYVGLSDRKPSRKMGTVRGDMQRGRRGGWMLTRSTVDPAVTRFTSCGIPGRRPGLRALVLKPETGRTHQLRVAAKSLGAPLLGDTRYASSLGAAQEERCYLHCVALRLVVGGEPLQAVCRPTEGEEFRSAEFREVFERWILPGMEADTGVWFAGDTLLRSGPLLL